MDYSRENLRKIFIYLGIFILACIVFISIINFIMGILVHSKKEIITPDFTNMSFVDGEKLAKSTNVKLKIESTTSNPEFAKDRIISQIPAPGFKIREGKEIKIIVSQGGQHIQVPDVLGLPQRMAEISITNNNAMIGEEKFKYSVVYDKGKVIEQDPLPNTVSTRGVMVNLLISDGEPPKGTILMPKVIGLSLDQAKNILDDRKIDYEVVNDKKDEELFVLSQSIDPDAQINKNQTLKIYAGTKTAFDENQEGNNEQN